uniref:PEHE domain-containing protein n=1 Tax=Caenorhabditis tropicalis TaxID=1561998 RepID=A0A1I7T5N3_9PELO
MGLLESTLNLNGDEVYARHHAMMDMMLKNREAQLLKMAELRKKLDAAEKVECCRRIRTGQSPESYRQGKPSRSLSRNRAGQKNASDGRQRRYSNSFEDRDYVQRIEEQNSDPMDQNTKDPYKRLSANAKRFNYLHKLDDKTLVAYKDNLQKQLNRLERFREISFGPHSVVRQPPPVQASWFFRRRSLPSLIASAPGNSLKDPLRSVLNIRGRKATTGNKPIISHDNRTSCPPTTRNRKDSNTRLPPINPQKTRLSAKPPIQAAFQQITSRLPPAAKKSIFTRHGIFTGAAAAAITAAIGTTEINIDHLLNDGHSEEHGELSPSYLPNLEIQETFDRKTSSDDVLDKIPSDVSIDYSVEVAKKEEQEHASPQNVVGRTSVQDTHGDYEDSDSDPEYAMEDMEVSEESIVGESQTTVLPAEPMDVNTQIEENFVPSRDYEETTPKEVLHPESPVLLVPAEEQDASVPPGNITTSPVLVQYTEELQQSPRLLESQAQQNLIVDVQSANVVEHFETHENFPESPVLSIHSEVENNSPNASQSPVMAAYRKTSHESSEPQTPILLENNQELSPLAPNTFDITNPSSHSLDSSNNDHLMNSESTIQTSDVMETQETHHIASEKNPVEHSPSSRSSESFDQQEAAPLSPVVSERSVRTTPSILHHASSVQSQDLSEHQETSGFSATDIPLSPVLQDTQQTLENNENDALPETEKDTFQLSSLDDNTNDSNHVEHSNNFSESPEPLSDEVSLERTLSDHDIRQQESHSPHSLVETHEEAAKSPMESDQQYSIPQSQELPTDSSQAAVHTSETFSEHESDILLQNENLQSPANMKEEEVEEEKDENHTLHIVHQDASDDSNQDSTQGEHTDFVVPPSDIFESVIESPLVDENQAKKEVTITAASRSPTEMDLYNLSRDDQEKHTSSGEVTTDDNVFGLVQAVPTKTEDIVDVVHEKIETPSEFATTKVPDAMLTSMYQESTASELDNYEEQEKVDQSTFIIEKGHEKIEQPSPTHSKFLESDHAEISGETVTNIISDDLTPRSENSSQNSLVNHPEADIMSQSIYQPRDEIFDGNERNNDFLETIAKPIAESGEQPKKSVTTIVDTNLDDDSINNNDDEDDDVGRNEEAIIEQKEKSGSNGNLIKESAITTIHDADTGSLPEGGILVDDGDETNISSL